MACHSSRLLRGAALFSALILCSTAATVAGPSRAHGQDEGASATDEQAKAHFQSGTLYFDRGEYESAAREFRAAYDLSGRPALLYNIYLALERLGRYQEAADTLEKYLRDSEQVANRASLEARLERLRERAGARN